MKTTMQLPLRANVQSDARVMSQACDLIASLQATNNGYLFAPTAPELAIARLHPELFTVTARDTIAPRGFKFEQHPAPKVSHARNLDCDFDYEGAILARQEEQGFYD